jgi:hypothetical protein
MGGEDSVGESRRGALRKKSTLIAASKARILIEYFSVTVFFLLN